MVRGCVKRVCNKGVLIGRVKGDKMQWLVADTAVQGRVDIVLRGCVDRAC